MNLRRISTRVAVAGVSTAIAAGGLVAATGVAAKRRDGRQHLHLQQRRRRHHRDFDLTVDGAIRCRSTGPALPCPGGLLNVTASAPVDAGTAALLAGAGVTGAKAGRLRLRPGWRGGPGPRVWRLHLR